MKEENNRRASMILGDKGNDIGKPSEGAYTSTISSRLIRLKLTD
jgi:hypothetical protein